jgi:hypothetical protein
MSGYMVFWSQDHVKKLKAAGDNGPIKVVYGGRHSKEPSLKKIKVGDVIFPVALEKEKLVVMARLKVERLENAFEYQLREVGMPCAAVIPEGTMTISDGPFTEKDGRFIAYHDGAGYLSNTVIPEGITRTIDLDTLTRKECAYHQIPITCCSEIAAVGCGSTIEARLIPEEKVPLLLFGNTQSSLKGLGNGRSGKITSVSLSGFVRKMSPETFEIFERLFKDK